jgi:hypothetical protein
MAGGAAQALVQTPCRLASCLLHITRFFYRHVTRCFARSRPRSRSAAAAASSRSSIAKRRTGKLKKRWKRQWHGQCTRSVPEVSSLALVWSSSLVGAVRRLSPLPSITRAPLSHADDTWFCPFVSVGLDRMRWQASMHLVRAELALAVAAPNDLPCRHLALRLHLMHLTDTRWTSIHTSPRVLGRGCR